MNVAQSFVGVVVVGIAVTMTGSGDVGPVEGGWSVVEDATPVVIGDSDGSVGSADVSAGRTDMSDYVANNEIDLVHPDSGSWRGRVASVSLSGLDAALSVAGPFEFLNVTRTAKPVGRTTSIPGVFLGTLTVAGTKIAVDSSGNIFTSSGNIVRKYNSSGTLLTSWGTFGTGDGQFNTTAGVAVDSTGAVYVVDQGNNRIQKFTNAGVFTLKWGSAGAGDGQFSLVQGIAISPTNEVYTVEFGNQRVQKFNTSGTFQTKWGSSGSGPSQFGGSKNIATDATGNVYVTSNTFRIQKFTNTGTYVTGWGSDGYGDYQFKNLIGIAVSSDGLVMVTDTLGKQVKVYTSAGVFVTRWGSAASGFTFPVAIAIGPTGTINVLADTGANILYQYGYSTFGGELLSSVFDTYMRLCDPDRTRDQFLWSASVDPIVNIVGWRDKVWVKIKELCAAYHVQIDDIGGVITVTDVGARTLTLEDNTPVKLNPVIQGGGLRVDVNYQNQTAGENLTMYSAFADNNKVHTVSIYQLFSVTLQTTSHPLTLDGLTPTDTAPATPGRYMVQDAAGLSIPAATWTYYGGKIDTTIGDTPGQIILTFTGPKGIIPGFTAPYSFASGSGTTRQAQLEVMGDGIITDPKTVKLYTAVDPTVTTQDVAQTINNVFIGTRDQAYARGAWASSKAAGPGVTITFTLPVKRLNGFGLVTGSLINYRDSRYRVINVTYGNLTAAITAVRHVTGTDFLAAHTGTSGTDFVALWAGFHAHDFKIRPLRTA